MRDVSPPPTSGKFRILIVDDHRLLRRGLTALIHAESDLVVCAEAATQPAGLEAVAFAHPDLVILDLSLGEGDGLALLKDIRGRDRGLPVLVLTVDDTPEKARQAFRAGANGYLTKPEMGEALIVAVHALLEGKGYVSPAIQALLDRG